jgi:hypothetical protein
MDVRIQCINKSNRLNPHERILSVGGINPDGSRWKMSQASAIQASEAGTYRFYVAVPAEQSVWVVVAISQWGHKYLKTQNDSEQPNNLLALPECP